MFRIFSNVLVFLLMLCVVMTIGILIRNQIPTWHSSFIAGITLFVVIDRLYTHRQIKSLTPFSTEWAVAFGTQWVVILVFSRLLLSYANGPDALRTDLSLFARGYLDKMFTGEFVMSLLLAFLLWYLTGQFLALIDDIGLEQSAAVSEEPIRTDEVPAHRRMVNLIFSLGIALVILAALSRIDLGSVVSTTGTIPDLELNRFSGGEAGALLYFVFALALLSLSRLMSLQTHWNRLRIPISSRNLARQWGLYSLFFLLILAVVVSLLPSGDSLGLFSLLGTLLFFLVGILLFIGQLLIALLALLISLPFVLFGKPSPLSGSVREPPPMLPMDPVQPIAGSEVWALIRSILLWGLLLVIVIFSVIHFARQHEGIRAVFRRLRIANWLALAWQWLYTNADRTRENLSRVISEGWQSIVSRLEEKPGLPRPGFIRLRSLDPRRRIYFYYLAMVRRGGEQGLGRKPSQTPAEYAASLREAIPSEEEDLGSITGAFVEARYSRHEINDTDAEGVKTIWGRIRRALQEKSNRRNAGNK